VHAITVGEPGGPDQLVWTEAPDPVPAGGEVVLDVAATAVNRADLLQRMGLYPPPPGASPILGLECSGRVVELGDDVTGWRVGDEACALLAGGGYAERVAVPQEQLMPLPPAVDVVRAAALPEVACTVWANVVMLAGLRKGETFLVHGGAGGIGTFAIQLGHALGARVIATAGTPEKLERCRDLGADDVINYREEDFVDRVNDADVILDNMGARYLDRNIRALARNGRLIVIGLQGGARGELDLTALMDKQGALHATTLRRRTVGEKARICAEVAGHVWPLLGTGAIRPVIDRVLPLPEAAAAHRIAEAGEHVGKLLLQRRGYS
jgi:putative PIG3 family NAD(P)H quinone oxidoreductase